MSNRPPPERWNFALDIGHDPPPPAVTARRVLKHLLRSWGIKCQGYAVDERIGELEAENERLRKTIDGMAARIAAQAELLERRAERGG